MLGLINKGGRMALKYLTSMPNKQKMILAERALPDLMFAGLETYLNPGDPVEKGLSGLGSFTGGFGGGLALSRLAGKNRSLGTILDMVGSIGGDVVGRAGAEQLIRGYDRLRGGKGQTAYESMGEKQQDQFKEQVQAQLLAELGLLPSSAQQYLVNPNNIG
tara:strand:+ start:1486 stop:1968 length:483 start_codon:yes stop_codon:yes gene_type:complete